MQLVDGHRVLQRVLHEERRDRLQIHKRVAVRMPRRQERRRSGVRERIPEMTEADAAAGDRWMSAIPAGLALVLLVLGAMLIGIDRYEVALGKRMRSWPSTTATVTRSVLRDEKQQDGRWFQYTDTTFRYVVDGRAHDFTSSEYAGVHGNDETRLRYHANDSVRVFYDPADPSQGSLTNERTSPTMLVMLLGALCFALSLPFWYVSVRMFRKRPPASAT